MNKRVLTVKGYIIRNGKRINREDLPLPERKRLANAWHTTAMEEAGYRKKQPHITHVTP